MDRAIRLIEQVKSPSSLVSGQRAYYEFVSGAIAAEQERNSDALEHLTTALDFDLRTDNDRALVELMLARLAIKRGESAEARELLNCAENRQCKPVLLKEISVTRDSLRSEP